MDTPFRLVEGDGRESEQKFLGCIVAECVPLEGSRGIRDESAQMSRWKRSSYRTEGSGCWCQRSGLAGRNGRVIDLGGVPPHGLDGAT